ncbi:MAG: 50S ribosomal protein L10 [Candidatus Saccharimonadales bacterium]
MALTKAKKNEVVDEISSFLATSKLTVIAKYQGTPVKALQLLRKQAKENGTHVQVVKNRLVIKALQNNQNLKSVDTADLTGMLLYAFNAEDEVAPAQALANFAKTQPTLEFVGAISQDGVFMSSEDVKSLASLPSKEQLRGILVGTIAAPLTGFMNVLNGNVRGIMNVLNARAQSLEQ